MTKEQPIMYKYLIRWTQKTTVEAVTHAENEAQAVNRLKSLQVYNIEPIKTEDDYTSIEIETL